MVFGLDGVSGLVMKYLGLRLLGLVLSVLCLFNTLGREIALVLGAGVFRGLRGDFKASMGTRPPVALCGMSLIGLSSSKICNWGPPCSLSQDFPSAVCTTPG